MANAGGEFARALELRPDLSDARELLAGVAWTMATSPDASVRNGKLAVQWAEQLRQLTGATEPAVLSALAAAYAEVGRYGDAVRTAEAALASPAIVGKAEFAAALLGQLDLYRSQKPYRAPQ